MFSNDGGKNWDTLITADKNWDQPQAVASKISINPQNDNEIIAAGRQVYYSKDKGKNFFIINLPDGKFASSLTVDWKNRILYVGILNVGVYKKNF